MESLFTVFKWFERWPCNPNKKRIKTVWYYKDSFFGVVDCKNLKLT